MARDDDPDGRLLRRDELDLLDGAGWRSTGKCDLAAKSRSGVGDALYRTGLSRARTSARLVDAGALYRRSGIHRCHADAKRTPQRAKSLVGTLAGDRLGSSLCGSNPLSAAIANA